MAADTSGSHPTSILNDSGAVFDVERAYDSGETAGTIISDKKRKGVLGQLKNAATELAGSATKAVKDVKLFEEEPPKPTVTPGSERKDIISKAVQSNQQAPKDDHDVVIERIRTFQKDAERVSGKPYLIQKNKEQPKSGWTHTTEESKPTPVQKPKPKPVVTETIRRTPEPKLPNHMEDPIIPTRKAAPAPKPEPAPVPEPAPQPTPAPTPAPRVRTEPPVVAVAPQAPSKLPRILGMVGIGIAATAIFVGSGFYIYSLFAGETVADPDTQTAPLELTLEETLPIEQLATLPLRLEDQTDTISQVVLTDATGTALSAAQFFTATAPTAPSTLARSLDARMLAGGVQSGSAVEPYLMFRAANFDNAFAGMLAWEAGMGNDLQELFSRAQGQFVDRVIENQHVRILYDATGTERLLYGFINGRILVITNTSAGFRTILRAI